MSYTVTHNVRAFKDSVDKNASAFLRNMAEYIVTKSFRNTPRKKGPLRKEVIKQVLGHKGKILWQARYAIYQENKRYRKYTTPGTGPHFARNAIQEGVNNTLDIAKKSGLI